MQVPLKQLGKSQKQLKVKYVWSAEDKEILVEVFIGSIIKRRVIMNKEYFTIPEICPVCGGETGIEISDSGTKNLIFVKNPNCEGKLVNKLDHFCGKKRFRY